MKNNRAMMRSLLLLVSLAFLAIGLRLNADAAEALKADIGECAWDGLTTR